MNTRVLFVGLILFSALLLVQNKSLSSDQISQEDFDEKLMEIIKTKDLRSQAVKLEALLSISNNYQRFIVLTYLPRVELNIQKTEKAASYAKELLYLSKNYKDDWNYGNAQHSANTVLGMVAIKEENIEEAKLYLSAAGDSKSSPQLETYGPSMVLANALLERGEKECVIEYLNKVKKIWKYNDGRLDSWISSIKGGGKPYFGVNLEW
jgi:tetratricopeptide (TPR) repeat protein